MLKFWKALTPPGKILVGFLLLIALTALSPLCATRATCEANCPITCTERCPWPCVCVSTPSGGVCVRRGV